MVTGAGWVSDEETGCPPTFAEGESGCAFDEQTVLGMMTTFRDSGFVRINAAPFVQQFGPPKMRNNWVSDTRFESSAGEPRTAAEVYAAIDPWSWSAQISDDLPKGTMIIHEAEELPFEVMVKREEGFAPDDNDWWFARYDGITVFVDSAPGYGGFTCRDCHVMDDRQLRTDMLWGVPRDSLP
jgi:hypothetical protein